MEAQKFDARLDDALETVELRAKYYEELRALTLRAAESVLVMRASCLKDQSPTD